MVKKQMRNHGDDLWGTVVKARRRARSGRGTPVGGFSCSLGSEKESIVALGDTAGAGLARVKGRRQFSSAMMDQGPEVACLS